MVRERPTVRFRDGAQHDMIRVAVVHRGGDSPPSLIKQTVDMRT